MNWEVWVILGIAIAGGLIWVLRRRKRREESPPAEAPQAVTPKSEPPTAASRKPPPPRKRSYFGASVQAGPNACDAAKALSGRRYLANEAPKFPLPDCNAATCKCQIIPHDDRRSGHDRRDSFSAYGDYRSDLKNTWIERKPGRRQDD